MIHLSSFEAIHYRGIDGLSLPELSRVNLITGANGVGKTALIEAIWLFMGRHNTELPWDATVQRSTNPIVNPISDLSDKSLELCGIEGEQSHEWKVVFEKVAEGKWDTVVVTDPERKKQAMEQHPIVGRLRTWIDNKELDGTLLAKELDGTLLARHNTPKELVERGFSDSVTPRPICIIEGVRWQLEISAWHLKIYSDMVREGRKEDLANAVNFILPNIRDVHILTDENGESYLSVITDNGAQRPLKDLGGGAVRLFKLYLAFFAARNGMLLIDEVENGLHYSVLRDIWDRIRTWTHEWNVQFIATTHSAECIDAAMEAFADKSNDLSIHNLFENESGNIKAATFTGEALEGARNLNLEVR